MTEGRRGATAEIPFPIELPEAPHLHIVGRGKDNQIVCHLYINATGLAIHRPSQVVIDALTWERLVEIVQHAPTLN